MKRRDFLGGAGTAAAVMVAAHAVQAAEHQHGDHAGHMAAAAGGNARLARTAAACIVAGQECLSHCLTAFAAGDVSLAACARSVNQMLAVCTALQSLAATGSSHLAAQAKVALDICQECEKECRKHEAHHATCKACAEACAACAEECRKTAI